jgi:hypothetical protein
MSLIYNPGLSARQLYGPQILLDGPFGVRESKLAENPDSSAQYAKLSVIEPERHPPFQFHGFSDVSRMKSLPSALIASGRAFVSGSPPHRQSAVGVQTQLGTLRGRFTVDFIWKAS